MTLFSCCFPLEACVVEVQPTAKQKRQRQQSAAEGVNPAGSLKRSTSEPAVGEQAAPAAQQTVPKVAEASPDILAAQAGMVIYEPAVSSAHLEITTQMLQDPAVKAQHNLLVKCCNIKRTGERLLSMFCFAAMQMRATSNAAQELISRSSTAF